MKKNKIKTILQSQKFTPSSEWQNSTLSYFKRLSNESVTNEKKSRNYYSSNLLNIIKMKIGKKAAIILGITAGVFTLTTGVVFASSDATPGSVFYPVEKAVENVQRTFKSSADKAKYENELLDKRTKQLEKVQKNDPNNVQTALKEVSEQKDRFDSAITDLNKDASVDANKKNEIESEHLNGDQKRVEVLTGVQEKEQEKGNDNSAEKIGEVLKKFDDGVKETTTP
ncbi:MAG: DUF5667 domain-containing protein, partial [bacterium]